MRICIPTSTSEGKKAAVNGHFGSTPFFAILDSDSAAIEFIENPNQHHSHGMCQPLSYLAGKDIDVVICEGMGARAVQKLKDAGIKAFRGTRKYGNVEELFEAFKKGEMEEISIENACMEHDCH
ncbi:MAG: hypothetical protein A2X49_12775 [Lentisphaerae bacterium GWF2_52_8]|nr:MAG: hypothetical protein A2X49_12775 [Lentisphaerae bacterium GWF2_52_8]